VRAILEKQKMPVAKHGRVERDNEFETAFSYMLLRYSRMNAEQKAESIRRILRTLGPKDREQLEEMIDILGTTGLKKDVPQPYQPPLIDTHHGQEQPTSLQPVDPQDLTRHGGECIHICPQREELSRIDQFYNEVFF